MASTQQNRSLVYSSLAAIAGSFAVIATDMADRQMGDNSREHTHVELQHRMDAIESKQAELRSGVIELQNKFNQHQIQDAKDKQDIAKWQGTIDTEHKFMLQKLQNLHGISPRRNY